jgi:hypothetical protein
MHPEKPEAYKNFPLHAAMLRCKLHLASEGCNTIRHALPSMSGQIESRTAMLDAPMMTQG